MEVIGTACFETDCRSHSPFLKNHGRLYYSAHIFVNYSVQQGFLNPITFNAFSGSS